MRSDKLKKLNSLLKNVDLKKRDNCNSLEYKIRSSEVFSRIYLAICKIQTNKESSFACKQIEQLVSYSYNHTYLILSEMYSKGFLVKKALSKKKVLWYLKEEYITPELIELAKAQLNVVL